MRTQFNRGGVLGQRGFSLIEMLITLALMIVMIVIFTSPGSFSRQKRDLQQCRKNLQTVFLAMSMYAGDHGGRQPVFPGAAFSDEPLSLLVPRGTTDTDIFICPGSGDKELPPGKPFSGNVISYAYYMGWNSNAPSSAAILSDRQVNTNAKKTGEPLFSTDGKKPGRNHHKYGGNVLFADGRVEKSRPAAVFDLPCPANVKLLNPRQ